MGSMPSGIFAESHDSANARNRSDDPGIREVDQDPGSTTRTRNVDFLRINTYRRTSCVSVMSSGRFNHRERGQSSPRGSPAVRFFDPYKAVTESTQEICLYRVIHKDCSTFYCVYFCRC